jgi:hypothetical protein
MSDERRGPLTDIRKRAKDYLPQIHELLKTSKHPKRGELENAIVDAAAIYVHHSKPQSKRRRDAVRKIDLEVRKLRAALLPSALDVDEREELHATLDMRLRIHPPGTLGHVFPSHTVDLLLAQLEGFIRTMDNGANLKRSAAKEGLCKNCLLLFDSFRPGEATTSQHGDFGTFVEWVFEIATGSPPQRETSMATPVKNALKRYRKLQSDGKTAAEIWKYL